MEIEKEREDDNAKKKYFGDVGLLIVLCMSLYTYCNLKFNSVYYAQHIPHNEGTETYLVMLVKNVGWIYTPKIDNIIYDDGTNDIINTKSKSFLTKSLGNFLYDKDNMTVGFNSTFRFEDVSYFSEEAKKSDVSAKEFDFDALAEAISKELESIDNMPKKETEKEEEPNSPVVPEPKENNFQVFEPIRIEETSVKKEEEKPVEEEKEIKPRPVMPTVFSSVYVNREKEEPKKTEEPVKPVKPSIDLPKIADLPKRAEEVGTTPETLETKEEDDGIIFR